MLFLFFLIASNCIFIEQAEGRSFREWVKSTTLEKVIEIAEKLLKDVEIIVDKALSSAMWELDKLKKELPEIKEKSVQIIGILSRSLDSFIRKKLDDLKTKYGSTTKVINCIERQENDLKIIPVRFTNETGKCLLYHFGKTIDDLEAIVKEVNKTEIHIKTIADEFYNCNNSPDFKICVLKVINHLRKAMTTLPEQIKGDVKKAEDILLQLKNNSVDCYNSNYDVVEDTAFDILAGIAGCVTLNEY